MIISDCVILSVEKLTVIALILISTSRAQDDGPSYSVILTPKPLLAHLGTTVAVKCCYNHGDSVDLESLVSLEWGDQHEFGCSNLDSDSWPDFSCSSLDLNNCRTIKIRVSSMVYNGAEVTCTMYRNGVESEKDSASLDIVEDSTKSTPTTITRDNRLDKDDNGGNKGHMIGPVLVVGILACVAFVIVGIIVYWYCFYRKKDKNGEENDGSQKDLESACDKSTDSETNLIQKPGDRVHELKPQNNHSSVAKNGTSDNMNHGGSAEVNGSRTPNHSLGSDQPSNLVEEDGPIASGSSYTAVPKGPSKEGLRKLMTVISSKARRRRARRGK